MNDGDLHYLKSILRHLRQFRSLVSGPSLGAEALADNIDWLDCFICKYEGAQLKQKQNFAAAMEARRAERKRLLCNE